MLLDFLAQGTSQFLFLLKNLRSSDERLKVRKKLFQVSFKKVIERLSQKVLLKEMKVLLPK
jgi:hypothetical protein